MSGKSDIFRIPPHYYVHVLDQNSNVTRMEIGPKTLILQDHELCTFRSPQKMIVLALRQFIKIKNPVKRLEDGSISIDKYGQTELLHGEEEIRTCKMGWYSVPFPLYPGEKISKNISKLSLIKANHAFHLRVLQDFMVDDEKRSSGEEYMVEGPCIYVPNVNVEKVRELSATVVKKGQALRLIATQNTIDTNGQERVAGEEWIHDLPGAYLPGVYEKVVAIINGVVLTEFLAVHVRALRSFTDSKLKQDRRNGDEYLITHQQCNVFYPSVNEEIVAQVSVNILTSRNYCVIMDYWDVQLSENRLGCKKLCVGPCAFFLHPFERLQNKRIEDVFVLTAEDGIVLSATEEFIDSLLIENEHKSVVRKPGDRWLIRGPMEFIPPVQAKVEDMRRTIALHENEGIYVRDLVCGLVRLIRGPVSYMLKENEERWNKELAEEVENLLGVTTEFGRVPVIEMSAQAKKRNKSEAVSYRVPANSCVQIYDYKQQRSRVKFGPSLVMLAPDENFTPLSLSGECPKRPNVIHTIHLLLGPDFCTDIINVETSDHAKLNLKLSYNWKFDVRPEFLVDSNLAIELFAVSDFIGDLCKQVSSRIRGAVASVSFEDFHKNSARLIRTSVFGINKKSGRVRDVFRLANNHLIVTGVDVKSIEPDNAQTQQALQSSVQQAIKITTDALQAFAKQEADRLEQEARGKLVRCV